MFTIVYGQRADRVILDRAIEDLTFLSERLDATYPKEQSRGRCLVFGDWGRCHEMEGEPHQFPSERDWERARSLRTAKVTG